MNDLLNPSERNRQSTAPYNLHPPALHRLEVFIPDINFPKAPDTPYHRGTTPDTPYGRARWCTTVVS